MINSVLKRADSRAAVNADISCDGDIKTAILETELGINLEKLDSIQSVDNIIQLRNNIAHYRSD